MKIKTIKYLHNYLVEVGYENGESHVFNLEASIKDFISKYDKFHELLNTEYFKTVRLNTEWNTIEWENGFDFAPELMQPAYATDYIK